MAQACFDKLTSNQKKCYNIATKLNHNLLILGLVGVPSVCDIIVAVGYMIHQFGQKCKLNIHATNCSTDVRQQSKSSIFQLGKPLPNS